MMSDAADDEWGDLKAFFQKYGRLMFYTILAAAIAIGGVFYYRHYKERQGLLAAALYQEALNAASQNRLNLAQAAAHRLEREFTATPYADQGALLLARIAYQQNHVPAAIDALTFAAHHGDWMLRTVARLRLSDLLLATGHPHQAWHYAQIAKPYGFKTLVLGLQAQILMREGHTQKARARLVEALKDAPPKSALTTLWRRELAQLQGVS